jgi:hypothetical protein
MTRRKEEISRIAERLFEMMMDTASYRNDLEEIGCKAEAKLLDTICSKLNILSEKLTDKVRK